MVVRRSSRLASDAAVAATIVSRRSVAARVAPRSARLRSAITHHDPKKSATAPPTPAIPIVRLRSRPSRDAVPGSLGHREPPRGGGHVLGRRPGWCVTLRRPVTTVLLLPLSFTLTSLEDVGRGPLRVC